jgi:hypothetical protein
MSTRSDLDRSITEWLVSEVPDRAPERLLEASRAAIRTTSQRRAWWPAGRVPNMNNNIVRIAAVVAAVAVAGFIGYQLLGAPTPIGPPAPPPSVSPSAEPSATPELTPTSFDDHPGGVLLPGPYVLTGLGPFEIIFTLPGGWEKLAVPNMVWTREDDKSTVSFGTIDDLVSDPCDPSQGYVGVGPTADDLVTALEAVPGFAVNSSEETSISGFTGTMVDIDWSEAGCAEGVEALLVVRQPGDFVDPHPGASDSLFDRWYVLDVDGERLVIATQAHSNATSTRVEEIQSILDSIQIQ